MEQEKELAMMREQQEEGKSVVNKKQENIVAAGGGGNTSKRENGFVGKLSEVLNPDGSVRESEPKIKSFVQLLDEALEWGQRKAVLKALQNSKTEILSKLILEKCLFVLEEWLRDAISQSKTNFVGECLSTLSIMPITLKSLISPCQIGKTVGNLRKNNDFPESVKSQARVLIAQWKFLASKGTSTATEDDTTRSKPTQVKPTDAKSIDAAKPAAGESSKSEKIHATKATKKTVLSSAVPQTKLGDADLFKESKPASSQAKPQHTSVRVVPSHAAVRTQTVVKPRQSSVAKVSASPLDSLPSEMSLSSPLNSSSSSVVRSTTFASCNPQVLMGPITAAQRAKMAADKVGDIKPREKKKTGKKIKWADEKSLKSVRWFLQIHPPSNAARDASMDDPEVATSAEQPLDHQNFVSAARMEHRSEAQVLRDHREQEGREREILSDRLNRMVPTIPWKCPPPIPGSILRDVAKGEDSMEKIQRQSARIGVTAKLYSSAAESPDCADEAADTPAQPLTLIQQIPLTVEQARAWNAARAGRRSAENINARQKTPAVPMKSSVPKTSRPNGILLGLHGNNKDAASNSDRRNTSQQNQPHRPMVAQPRLQPMVGLHGPAIKHQMQQNNMASSKVQKPCAYFNTPNGCIHGDNCKFAHEPLHQEAMKRNGQAQPSRPRKMVKQTM